MNFRPVPPEGLQPDEVRRRLEAIVAGSKVSLAELSRFLGRNEAYLQQFIKRGTPRKLDEDDRSRLAQFLGVDERELGAREPWRPHIHTKWGRLES